MRWIIGGHSGQTALKVIAFTGAVAFVMLIVLAQGMKHYLKPDASQKVKVIRRQSPFDGTRAYGDLESIVGSGPRVSGSEGIALTRKYLEDELASAGLAVSEQAFEGETPSGKVKMVNLWAVVEGDHPGVIVVGGHYDTAKLDQGELAGANEGGSSTALLLELARALGPKRQGRSVWLVWFDGKTWPDGASAQADGLLGSRAFVERLCAKDEIRKIGAMLCADMVGDCYLGIHRDADAPDWLGRVVSESAIELGYGKHFVNRLSRADNDHTAFRQAGVPAMLLVDFSYGGSIAEHKRNWRTENDRLDLVCEGSLQAVGDVLYHSIQRVDASLDAKGKGVTGR